MGTISSLLSLRSFAKSLGSVKSYIQISSIISVSLFLAKYNVPSHLDSILYVFVISHPYSVRSITFLPPGVVKTSLGGLTSDKNSPYIA